MERLLGRGWLFANLLLRSLKVPKRTLDKSPSEYQNTICIYSCTFTVHQASTVHRYASHILPSKFLEIHFDIHFEIQSTQYIQRIISKYSIHPSIYLSILPKIVEESRKRPVPSLSILHQFRKKSGTALRLFSIHSPPSQISCPMIMHTSDQKSSFLIFTLFACILRVIDEWPILDKGS